MIDGNMGMAGSARCRGRAWLRLWMWLALLLLPAGNLHAEPVDMSSDWRWEYRWGDSPFVDGVPQWTLSPQDDEWKPIDFPSNPPGRNGRENVWYRTTLPEGEWRDPVLYIFSVDLIVEAYVDGRMIYRYGRFDEQGRGEFSGWPWHMITLPEGSAGKPIHFRVFSNYLDIGLWGEVKVMERMALLNYIIGNSIDGMLVAGFSLLIALLALVFALLNSGRRLFIAVALYSLASAGLALEKSPAHLLLLHKPLFWNYISAISYFLTPVAMALRRGGVRHRHAGCRQRGRPAAGGATASGGVRRIGGA